MWGGVGGFTSTHLYALLAEVVLYEKWDQLKVNWSAVTLLLLSMYFMCYSIGRPGELFEDWLGSVSSFKPSQGPMKPGCLFLNMGFFPPLLTDFELPAICC